MKKHSLLAGLFLAAAMVPTVQALPILGAKIIVANTGNVTAKFISGSASYADLLYLHDPANPTMIFHNHTTAAGTTFDLGNFTAGTELIFRIDVYQGGDNDNGLDDRFYTGDASRNADNIFHAIVDTAYAPGETSVGFEDIYGGGDFDFNDIIYSFTNIKTEVPEPASLALMSIGLLGLGLARRRKA